MSKSSYLFFDGSAFILELSTALLFGHLWALLLVDCGALLIGDTAALAFIDGRALLLVAWQAILNFFSTVVGLYICKSSPTTTTAYTTSSYDVPLYYKQYHHVLHPRLQSNQNNFMSKKSHYEHGNIESSVASTRKIMTYVLSSLQYRSFDANIFIVLATGVYWNHI